MLCTWIVSVNVHYMKLPVVVKVLLVVYESNCSVFVLKLNTRSQIEQSKHPSVDFCNCLVKRAEYQIR
jgi:hypothetical protein